MHVCFLQNVVAPFDNYVWGCVAGIVVAVSIAFFVLYQGYSRIERLEPLLEKVPALLYRQTICQRSAHFCPQVQHPIDYFVVPLSMLVTQDRAKWFRNFPRNSGGPLLVLCWTVLCYVMNLSYQSNLRASLIAVDYEEPIATNQAIASRALPEQQNL